MAIVSEDHSSLCYDIKSAELSLVALVLKTTDMSAVSFAFKERLAESPDFFDQDPLVIDVSGLSMHPNETIDLKNLLTCLREHRLVPLAIKGAQPALLAMAMALGLVDGSDARIRRFTVLGEHSPTAAPPPPAQDLASAKKALSALWIEKPLRSGQQVYAKGRDLIVMGMVNPGAEVIADGHIHVYGSLRGKAIAGARGNVDARIFAQMMEPELISIAGIYRTSENPLSADVFGKAVQVSLRSGPDGDKLLITPFKT